MVARLLAFPFFSLFHFVAINNVNLPLKFLQILDLLDLPLTREKGVSYPYIQVVIQTEEDNQKVLFYEVLNYSREKTCNLVGLPMEKIRTSSLKFVVLDYDNFSRTEFVADVTMPLEHINIAGEEETRPLCVVTEEEVSNYI